jgi:hypothetical protein
MRHQKTIPSIYIYGKNSGFLSVNGALAVACGKAPVVTKYKEAWDDRCRRGIPSGEAV